jgi:hypothetical protein
VVAEIVKTAREMYEAEQQPDDPDRRRKALEATNRELARLTDAVAAGGDVPVLVERLRATEAKRRGLVVESLEATLGSSAARVARD